MIPTSVSSSPSPAAACGSGSSSSNYGSTAQPSVFLSSSSSPMLGIAALILEGRAIAVDEYQLQQHQHQQLQHSSSSSGSHTDGRVSGDAGGSKAALSMGRQSPLPSTSRAGAGSLGGGAVINITANPHAYFGPGRGSLGGGGSAAASSSSAAPPFHRYMETSPSSSGSTSSAESTHQRWTQKLCQLRQASPAASHGGTYEQKVTLCELQPEVVALAINAESRADRGDYEIVRRAMLNRANLSMPATAIAAPTASAAFYAASASAVGGTAAVAAGSANSSPGSENFLYSLQSLATTCLRGAGPSTTESPNYRYTALRSGSPHSSAQRFPYPGAVGAREAPCSASSSGSGVQSPERLLWTPLRAPKIGDGARGGCSKKLATTTRRIPIPSPSPSTTSSVVSESVMRSALLATARRCSPPAATAAAATTDASGAPTMPSRYPQQGPHCDQFLRKMGLAKGEAADAEDHICDMSYVNITCSRWRAYCVKMDAIVARREAVCIEVYLGPFNHKILLEQWIITQKDKVPPPTMTLPSLCSAIRSQLYFSQISAWCDLIKKDDQSVYETGRIIIPTATGAAGDLATPACSPPSTQPPPAQLTGTSAQRRPRLNIFYRVKPYDASDAFSSQPNVHNFPNVNYSENCSISVCLKSLPRINGGIPRIVVSPPLPSSAPTPVAAAPAAPSPTGIDTATVAAPAAATTTTTTAKSAKLMPRSASNGGPSAMPGAVVAASSSRGLFGHFEAGHSASPSRSSNGDRKTSQEPAAAGIEKASNGNTNGSGNGTVGPAKNGALHGRRHKLNFYIDEDEEREEEDDDEDDDEGEDEESCGGYDELDEDGNTSDCTNGGADSSNSSFSSNAHLSHREKQLLKYRKHMLKRDKMHRRPQSDAAATESSKGQIKSEPSQQSCDSRRISQTPDVTKQPLKVEVEVDLPPAQSGRSVVVDRQQQHQPMEQGGEENATPKRAASPEQQRPATHTRMISTGTQTQMICCQKCGSVKTLLCLRCRGHGGFCAQGDSAVDGDGEDMDSSSSISSSDIISTPRNKAELLLQAIQRTPKTAKKHKKQMQRSLNNAAASAARASLPAMAQNNNHVAPETVAPAMPNANAAGGGCQVCKRQKTEHDFANAPSAAASESKAEVEADAEVEVEAIDCDDVVAEAECVDGAAEENHGERLGQVNGGEEQPQAAPAACDDDDHQEQSVAKHDGTTAAGVKGVDCHAEWAQDVMEEESFYTRTKLTPYIDRCSLSATVSKSDCRSPRARAEEQQPKNNHNNNNTADEKQRSCTPPTSICDYLAECDESARATQFKTPPMTLITTVVCSPLQEQQQQAQPQHHYHPQQAQHHRQGQAFQQHQHQLTPKPHLLQVSCNYHGGAGGDCITIAAPRNALLLRKGVPKVNLTPIFCSPAPECSAPHVRSLSAPIAIAHGQRHGGLLVEDTAPTPTPTAATSSLAFCFDAPTAAMGRSSLLSTTAVTTSSIPVQKSFSAPTLPNSTSPSLSPRFAKQAAIYKRRSRHLSDRSDRSSLGSDEQFSDEDFDGATMYNSPATSPLKNRARIAAVFGRQPLLGNLEESLLQKRLMPKVEVAGFKVLLGASGGFCPTQLTIPAAAYFYELHGESLSTPYVCEIRLPRKGYTVPRIGTVQATLLNPMGTVVRMFVIPYDLSDMPNLRQTFIRQRVLAEASGLNERIGTTQIGGFDVADGDGAGGDAGAHAKRFLNGFGTTPIAVDTITSFANGCATTTLASTGSNGNNNHCLGHFISAEHMKRLRYSIHLRFQTSRTGRLSLHTDIRLLIARRTDCDTAAAHAKGVLEAPNDLVTDTLMPQNPKYSSLHHENTNKI